MRKLSILLAFVVFVLWFNTLAAYAQPQLATSDDSKTETRTILVNGVKRSYLIHLPTSYTEQMLLPLVIALHGGGGNPEQFARDTGFSSKANVESFIVVYPRGTGQLPTWDAIHCCGEAFNDKTDDVGFISALIEEMIGTQHVDPKRVYVAGHSNGGFMAYRLGAELSDKIAAISVSAGTIGGRPRIRLPLIRIPKPANPVPLLAFHGKLDEHVRYDGGITTKGLVIGRYDLSVADSVAFWVQANHCAITPAIKSIGKITIENYTKCAQNAEVALYTIVDQGHAWPGGKGGIADTPTKDISATDISWEFFKAHPKQ